MIRQLIPEIEEVIDYLSKISPGLNRYRVIISENEYANTQNLELPEITIDRFTPDLYAIAVRLLNNPEHLGDETQYTRFYYSAVCNEFLLDKQSKGVVYAVSSELLSAADTYNTICRILYHFGYNPSVKLHIVRLIDKSPNQPVFSSNGVASYSQASISSNQRAFPTLNDAINDAIKLIENTDSYNGEVYVYIAIGTTDKVEKVNFFIEDDSIVFLDENCSSDTGFHSPEKLNKYIGYKHSNLLSISSYSVSLCLPLKNKAYTLQIMSDFILFLHPELTPENLVAIIKPLVFEPEFAPDLFYFPDGTKPTPEQLTDAKARIIHQIELDNSYS